MSRFTLVFLLAVQGQVYCYVSLLSGPERCPRTATRANVPSFGKTSKGNSVGKRQRQQEQSVHHPFRSYSATTTTTTTSLTAFANFGDSGSCNSNSWMISSVPIFDGSSITEPMVVSSSYWTNLSNQLTAYLLGQLLAMLLFAVLVSLTVQQVPWMMQRLCGNSNTALTITTTTTTTPKLKKLKIPPPEQGQSYRSTEATIELDKLVTCLVLDFVGSASELIPGWGMVTDVVYAPTAAFVLRRTFGGSNVAFVIEFLEEVLPFTDLLPFCTICWIIHTFLPESNVAQALQLGDFTPQSKRDNNQE